MSLPVHEYCISLHLFQYSFFLSSAFYNFQHTYIFLDLSLYSNFGGYYKQYFKKFPAVYCKYIGYTVDYLNLHSATLLNSFISFRSFFVDSMGFSTQRIMSANRAGFFFFFNLYAFYFFSFFFYCTGRGVPYDLLPDLGGKPLVSHR